MEDSGRYRFFNLVKEMRKAQNEYFSTHSHYALINARNLEQKVDKYIQNGDKYIESKQPQQATLFDNNIQIIFKTMKYIGKKEVKAIPMTANEAVQKGYKVGNHENEDGYEVEYNDGYKSWSPKQVFDDSYRVADTFLDRLKIENEELSWRIIKLNDFINSEAFANLGSDDRTLLEEQRGIMYSYKRVLEERITKASGNNA